MSKDELDTDAIQAEAMRRYPEPINFDGEGNLWEHRRGGRLGFRVGAEWALAARDAEGERLRAGIARIVDRYGSAPGIETCATMYDLRRLAEGTS